MRVWLGLAAWIAAALAAGAVGGAATTVSPEFYGALRQPAWAPPSWLFGPVWTALYVLMGTAAWLVWRERPADAPRAAARRRGLILFGIQLALNAVWSWLFFRWRLGGLAFADIVLLALAVVLTAAAFRRVRAAAAWLLAPYLMWLIYAGALNWWLWRANPDLL